MHIPFGNDSAGTSLDFLAGEGEMRKRIREFDWSTSALGEPAGWPDALKSALEIVLNCGTPAYIAWGPDFIQFYNDAYIAILGNTKHPQALGATTPETWSEIWDFVGEAFQRVLETGQPVAMANALLLMQRNGYLEECYFSFSYSALFGSDSACNGVLAVVCETTGEFISYRRANALRMLVQHLHEASDTDGVRRAFEKTVYAHPHDLPFGLWYEAREDGNDLDLVAAAGIARGSALCPENVDAEHGGIFRKMMDCAHPAVQRCSFPPELITWTRPTAPPATPRVVMLKPLRYSTHARPDGYVGLALNPMRPDDAGQQDFLQLIRLHLENAVRRVNRVEVERREYEHQFHSIMSVLPCLVWMTDQEGNCSFVNGTWQELTGMTAKQAMGIGWSEAVHPDDRAAALERAGARLHGPLTIEYRLRGTAGKYHWMLDTATPRYGIHGEFLGCTGTCIDITERKNTEQRMHASQTELRNLYDQLQTVRDQERRALAREVHDQLGQILSAAKIDIKLLEDGIRADEGALTREDIVAELQSASISLERAIGVVRRLATELRPPELESQDLPAAIQWHARDFERRTRIRCNVSLDPCTPRPGEAAATALLRIFQESMTNVLRHARATEVWISLVCRPGMVLLRVRDNGVGISMEQAHSPRSIGLKGMRERALLAGGRLVVGAVRPSGTLVAARVPLEDGQCVPDGADIAGLRDRAS